LDGIEAVPGLFEGGTNGGLEEDLIQIFSMERFGEYGLLDVGRVVFVQNDYSLIIQATGAAAKVTSFEANLPAQLSGRIH
jgi:hypothetical protein